MKKLLLIVSIIFILTGCEKEIAKVEETIIMSETTTIEGTSKVLGTTAVGENTMEEEVTAQLESTTFVVVETTQPETTKPLETTKIAEETKSKVEVNIGGAEVEFTEEELKEPEIDFAKLQEELAKKQQELAEQQALQAQAAAQQAAQAQQSQGKQGTDKKGHPYLQPGASYTWGADGKPIEAPENGGNAVVTNPNTGQTFGYSQTTGKWLDITNGNEKEHEAFRKSMEGTHKLTKEEADRIHLTME